MNDKYQPLTDSEREILESHRIGTFGCPCKECYAIMSRIATEYMKDENQTQIDKARESGRQEIYKKIDATEGLWIFDRAKEIGGIEERQRLLQSLQKKLGELNEAMNERGDFREGYEYAIFDINKWVEEQIR